MAATCGISVINTPPKQIVGLVPAAGRASRIAPSPCSKEIYPVGFHHDAASGIARPRVASHHLFEKLRAAGASMAFVIIRSGKWDICSYFEDGASIGVPVGYLVISDSIGPPDTLDRAYAFVQGHNVLFGFPDILFGPDDAFERLAARLGEARADVVLGLYPAHDVTTLDMVDVDASGRVCAMVLKPRTSSLRYTWLCATWTPAFTEFMHSYLACERGKSSAARDAYRDIDAQGDLPMGAVIKAAVEDHLHVHAVVFEDEPYLDIGTPESLMQAMKGSRVPDDGYR